MLFIGRMNFSKDYQHFFDTYGDDRVKGWLLMESPLPTTWLCLLYGVLVTKIGPKLMANREPFNLRKILITYNFMQVIISIFLFYEGCVNGWLTFYSYTCQPVDYSDSPVAVRMLRACYFYFLSKFLEFFDTFFFVLRKSNHQISTLHVIHHGIMPMSVWWGVKFSGGGHLTFFGFVNTFVHIIMYSYYLIAALGPPYKKYLWWKKYLTVLQMVQFLIVGIHTMQLFFIDCDHWKGYLYIILAHVLMFLYLFYNFYDNNYRCPSITNGTSKRHYHSKSHPGVCFPDQDALQNICNGNGTGSKKR